jgi:hypothetical protein
MFVDLTADIAEVRVQFNPVDEKATEDLDR